MAHGVSDVMRHYTQFQVAEKTADIIGLIVILATVYGQRLILSSKLNRAWGEAQQPAQTMPPAEPQPADIGVGPMVAPEPRPGGIDLPNSAGLLNGNEPPIVPPDRLYG